METILVAKTGGSVYMPDQLERQTPTSEQGATSGLIHHLASRYRVVYHGQVKGKLPDGVIHVAPDLSHVNQDIPEKEHEARCRADYDIIREHCPKVFVNVAGYSPSWACTWNPRRVSPLCNAIRYNAPQLAAAGWLGIPRIVMNADLRCYPREGEMTHMWPNLIPCALMSQITRSWPATKRVAGTDYLVREVACGMENWHTLGRELPPGGGRDVDMCTMSHAHVKDGFGRYARRIGEARDRIWREMLDVPWLKEKSDSVIYGEGWEHVSCYDPDLMPGPISPAQVVPELQRARCGLIVTPWGDDPYVTSKVRYYAWAGCVPVMYGHGEWVPHMGDGVGRYVPLEQGPPYRARTAEELNWCIEHWRCDERREEWTAELELATRPRFDVIDRCVDDLIADRATDTDEWWEEYGGYRRYTA